MKRLWIACLAALGAIAPAAAQGPYPMAAPGMYPVGAQPGYHAYPMGAAPAHPSYAEQASLMLPPMGMEGGPVDGEGHLSGAGGYGGCGYCPAKVRISADYLHWWLKPVRISTPLVGTLADPTADLAASIPAGGLADPNTVILFNAGNRERGPYSGGRLTLAYDPEERDVVGGELIGLWLPRQGNRFLASSNAAGIPPLTLFFFAADPDPANGLPVGETAGVFAGNFAGAPLAGSVDIHTSTQLWGGEANATFTFARSECVCLTALIGFRYLGLQDDVTIRAALTGQNGSTFDRFQTKNHFYGGQFGARALANWGCVRASLTSKVALGSTQETLNISGSAITTDASTAARAGAAQLPGGFYTASSNLGKSTNDRFAVVSDTNLTLAVQVTHWLAVNLGYSFLYWSDVMRAGEQIDRRINSNLNPNFAPFIGGTGGPNVPARLGETNDFWAHGVNAGLELKF